MTTLTASFAPPLYGRSSFDQMSESEDLQWRQQYYAQAPMLTQQWPNQHMSGRQSLDISMYADEPYSHVRFFPTEAWADMEAGTPSSTSYAHESPELAIPALPVPGSHLQIPGSSRSHSNPTHSPNSSQGGMSPRQSPMPMPYGVGAAAHPQDRRSTGSSASPSSRARALSEEDGDYEPNDDARRGKKRQRIPHTAVEKRYRENLNAHLDKLRQTVPTLAARGMPGKGGVDRGDGAKPSKCEILNGAIDHIGSLDRENFALRNEVRALRSKIDDLDAWYRSNPH